MAEKPCSAPKMRKKGGAAKGFAMYSFLLALIYLAFISLGLPDALLGAAWPVMHSEFGVSVSYMGMISIIISMAREISSESVKTLENSSPLPQFISSGTVLFFSK